MQFQATISGSAAALPVANTDRLRFRLEELSASGFIPTKTRQVLQQLLMRIDLSTSSPTPIAVEACRELWISVKRHLEQVRNETILPPHVDSEFAQMVSTFCENQIARHQSLMVTPCLICGDDHKLQKRHLVMTKPDAWFYLSPADIAERCEGNENFLSIDMQRFFIRGILPFRYQEDTVEVEMWAEVRKDEFSRFIDRFLSAMKEQTVSSLVLTIKGNLANRLLHGLTDCDEAVEIVCEGDLRPVFWLSDKRIALFKGQREGLSTAMFSQMFSSFAHSQSLLEKKTRRSGDGALTDRLSFDLSP
jgi:hypothetical protein